jgi:hypothetical protein
MRTASARPIEPCLLDLLQHFGIERAHIAAGGPPPLKDWQNLETLHPERVSSLTLISPPNIDSAPLAGLASRMTWRSCQAPVRPPKPVTIRRNRPHRHKAALRHKRAVAALPWVCFHGLGWQPCPELRDAWTHDDNRGISKDLASACGGK